MRGGAVSPERGGNVRDRADLFFGLTIPLALQSAAGWTFPAPFAAGTALPLLAFAGLLAVGSGLAAGLVDGLKRSHRTVSRVAGLVFIP